MFTSGRPARERPTRTPLLQLQVSVMSLPSDRGGFSALRIVERFSQDQLEHLTEFSDQVESLRFLSRNLPGPPPSLEQAIEIVQAAPTALGRKKKRGKTDELEKAWHAELGTEFASKANKEGDRLPAVLSRGEIKALLEAASEDPRDYLMLRVFYAAGLRISEVAKLLVADLYLDELKMFIRDGKGDKDRYVLIDPDTAALLRTFTAELKPKDRVFKIGERQISRVVLGYAEDLGICERYEAIGRSFTPHSLRHTTATHLYENGMDIYVIKDLLGHASVTVTREYIHTGINHHRQKYQAFHPLCQSPTTT